MKIRLVARLLVHSFVVFMLYPFKYFSQYFELLILGFSKIYLSYSIGRLVAVSAFHYMWILVQFLIMLLFLKSYIFCDILLFIFVRYSLIHFSPNNIQEKYWKVFLRKAAKWINSLIILWEKELTNFFYISIYIIEF